jgi:hypothetical protein
MPFWKTTGDQIRDKINGVRCTHTGRVSLLYLVLDFPTPFLYPRYRPIPANLFTSMPLYLSPVTSPCGKWLHDNQSLITSSASFIVVFHIYTAVVIVHVLHTHRNDVYTINKLNVRKCFKLRSRI